MAAGWGRGAPLAHGGRAPTALPPSDSAVPAKPRREVDQAAITLAREAYRRARALISANLELVDHLAVLALERETLTREELDEIFAAHDLHGLAAPGSGAALVALSREAP